MKKVEIGDATRIYALCEFPSMEIRYVGKTMRSLLQRLKGHMQAAKKPQLPVGRWISKRRCEGKKICIKLLETVQGDKDWASREKFWILKHKQDGARLLNLTDGGEGLSGHIFSEEHKAKIGSALRTGAYCTCLNCGSIFWRKKNQIAKGDAKYCTRDCYQVSQIGKPKINTVIPLAAILAAANARKAMTTCKRGHELSGSNLFLTSIGGRGCKECRKLHKATYLARSK